MASSRADSPAAATGHRKWRRRRAGGARGSPMAPSGRLGDPPAPTSPMAGGVRCVGRRRSCGPLWGAIFHDKNRKSSSQATIEEQKKKKKGSGAGREAPNEERERLLLLLLLVTRLRALHLVAPDAFAMRPLRRGRRRQPKVFRRGDNRISGRQQSERAEQQQQQFKRSDQKLASARTIIFIKFNYHNNKLAGAAVAVELAARRLACFVGSSRCDIKRSERCDCRPVIIRSGEPRHERLRPRRRQTRGRRICSCELGAGAPVRVGGISGGLGDIITFGWRRAAISRSARPGFARGARARRRSQEAAASSGLKLIAPVCCWRRRWLLAAAEFAGGRNDSGGPIISAPRAAAAAAAGERLQLNKVKQLLRWRRHENKVRPAKRRRKNSTINQSPSAGGAARPQSAPDPEARSAANLSFAFRVNNSDTSSMARGQQQQHDDGWPAPNRTELARLICLDQPPLMAALGCCRCLRGCPSAAAAAGGSSRNLSPPAGAALANLFVSPLGNADNADIDDIDDDADDDAAGDIKPHSPWRGGDTLRDSLGAQSLNNSTNNGRPTAAHYCYHRHHHYYDHDYYHCCYNRRRRRGRPTRRSAAAAAAAGAGEPERADMLHCVAGVSGGRAAASLRTRPSGSQLAAPNSNSSSNNNSNNNNNANNNNGGYHELITNRENSNHDSAEPTKTDDHSGPSEGRRALADLPLRRVGVAKLGFQLSGRRRSEAAAGGRQVLLLFGSLLSLLLLLAPAAPLCKWKVAARSSPPSIMGRRGGSEDVPAGSGRRALQPPVAGRRPTLLEASSTWAPEQQPRGAAAASGGPSWLRPVKGDRWRQQQQQYHRQRQHQRRRRAGQMWPTLSLDGRRHERGANKTKRAAVVAASVPRPDKIGGGQIERIGSSERPYLGASRSSGLARKTAAQPRGCSRGQSGAELTGSHSGHELSGALMTSSADESDADGAAFGAERSSSGRIDGARDRCDDAGAADEDDNYRRSFSSRAKQELPAKRSVGRRAASGESRLVLASGQTTARQHRTQHHYGFGQTAAAGGSSREGQQLCASKCQCVWKNGKQSADCSQLKLAEPPAGLDPLLQVLNMSSNPLRHLAGDAFNRLGLNNLQRIFLSSCQLHSIDQAAFANLKLVVELDFSWNRLQFVPLAQIGRMSLLRKLNMRGNPLKSLTESTFSTQRAPDSTSAASLGFEAQSARADPAQDQRSLMANNLSRLYESFPALARALLRRPPLSQRKSSSVGGKSDDEDSFIIEQMELEVLESIVRQHEQIGADDADADETVADDLGELENDIDASSQDENSTSNDDRRTKSAREEDFPGAGAANEPNRAEKGASSLRRSKSRSLSSAAAAAAAKGLGGHFSQLQELDFGRCQLTYIKWSVFDQLDQLKRLHLDGNQLSQLSGKLVETLPLGLHQLSLEENPWRCDCRLLALKRWLQSTRTPLSAPVKCSQRVADGAARRLSGPIEADNDSGAAADGISNESSEGSQDVEMGEPKEQDEEQEAYLERLEAADFVCAPEASSCSASVGNSSSSSNNNNGHSAAAAGGGPRGLASLLAYLEPRFISGGGGGGGGEPSLAANITAKTQTTTSGAKQAAAKLVEAHEGGRVELSCSFVAQPADWTLRVLWMADFSSSATAPTQAQQIQPTTAARQRQQQPYLAPSTILYDSRLDTHEHFPPSNGGAAAASSHKGTQQQQQQQQQRATQTKRPGPMRFEQTNSGAKLTTRLIIESVNAADAARYKCLAANRAGLASLDVSLRVNARPARLTAAAASVQGQDVEQHIKSTNNSNGRDQRSWQEQVNRLRAEQSLQVASTSSSSHVAANAKQQQPQQQQQQQQQTQTTSSVWLRSSTTFQVTIMIVSALMAAVIVAFILFCIIIYQIKPSGSHGAQAAATGDYFTNTPSQPQATLAKNQGFFKSFGFTPNHMTPLAANGSSLIMNGGPISTFYSPTPVCATTPLLAATVSDCVTGQTPVHFIAHQQPTLQHHQPIQYVTFGPSLGQSEIVAGSRHAAIVAVPELSQQEQDSIRVVNNWNTTTNTTTTTTTISPRNSYSPASSQQSSGTTIDQPVQWHDTRAAAAEQSDSNNNLQPPFV